MIESTTFTPEEEKPNYQVEEIIVAGDKGPCGGVNMAIETTFEVLGIVAGREKVYTNHQPVHNALIMTEFGENLVVEENIERIPNGSILIASAHGWGEENKKRAKEKGILLVDETCHYVNKVRRAAVRAVDSGNHVIYLGAQNHPEPTAVLDGLPEDSYTFIDIEAPSPFLISALTEKTKKGDLKITTLNQTTLSTQGILEIVNHLRELNPDLEIPDPTGICYATDNRQKSVRDRLFDKEKESIDMLVVVGSKNSHNSNEIRDIGAFEAGIPSYLIDKADEIDPTWFNEKIKRIMISSGASVLPEYLERVINFFKERGTKVISLEGTEKDLTFVTPELDTLWKRYDNNDQIAN